MNTIAIIIEKQTLPDIAIQYTGDAEQMFAIAELNNLGVSDFLQPGTKIILPEIEENTVNAFYKANNLNPASGWSEAEQKETEEMSGIGYWHIEDDFIVT